MKHTKGPWKVGFYDDMTAIIVKNKTVCVFDREAFEPQIDYEQEMANADLIAAAPNMLEALTAALAELTLAQTYTAVDVNVITKVKFAIEKATGEKHAR